MTAATLALAQSIDAVVKKHGRYAPDPPRLDRWRSYADAVQRGEGFVGDCDDYAQTAVALAFLEGVPHYQLFRCIVSTPGKSKDHMIGLVHLDDGTFCSIGDTNFPPAKVRGDGLGPYVVELLSRLGEMDAEGEPRWRVWEKAP